MKKIKIYFQLLFLKWLKDSVYQETSRRFGRITVKTYIEDFLEDECEISGATFEEIEEYKKEQFVKAIKVRDNYYNFLVKQIKEQ